MKIVLVNPILAYVRGGAETNDLNLGKALADLGHEVSYLVVRDSRRSDHALLDWAATETIEMPFTYDRDQQATGPGGKLARHRFFHRFANAAAQRSRTLPSADLVLLTGRPALTRLRRATRAPMLQAIRGRQKRYNAPWVRRADGVVFWGGCERDNPAALKRRPWLALDPSVETELFHPGPAEADLRRQLRGGAEDGVALVYVGRLEPVQQVATLIRATGRALSAGHRVHLNLVGDGSDQSHLESVAAAEAPGRVSFLGRQPRPRIAAILRAADMFLLYPRIENHPISLKEAVACNLFALAPDLGRVRDILGDAGGWAIPANREEALQEALLAALAQEAYRLSPADRPPIATWQDNARRLLTWAQDQFALP